MHINQHYILKFENNQQMHINQHYIYQLQNNSKCI